MKLNIVGTVLLLSVLSGCGGAASDNITAFVGSWTATVNQSEMCPAGNDVTPLNGTLTIVAGATAGEITTEPGNGCNLTWTVSGNVANLKGTQTCPTVPGAVGGTWTATFTGGKLSLSGTTITLSDKGTAVYVNGTTENCTFTESGTVTN